MNREEAGLTILGAALGLIAFIMWLFHDREAERPASEECDLRHTE